MVRDKELTLEDDESSHIRGAAGEGVHKEGEVNRRLLEYRNET